MAYVQQALTAPRWLLCRVTGSRSAEMHAHWRYNGAMTTIQVKDLPEEVAETFRRRAAESGQSLQAYMRQYLIAAAHQRSKAEYLKIIEENLAKSHAPGATAESIDEALREARGE